MLYQEDWFMRQIEAMTRAIAQLALHRELGSETSETYRADLNARSGPLDKLLSDGEIGAAEDWLFENMDTSDPEWLEIALHFYLRLSKIPETDLRAKDFSQEEVLRGLQDVCRAFGHEELPIQ